MKERAKTMCTLRAMSESATQHHLPAATASHPDFWNGMSPCEHFVHLYDGKEGLLDLLQGFIADGLRGGDATVVIATPEHLAALDRRLNTDGFDLVAARWQGQYLPMDAKATLGQFMVNGMPDEEQFARVMGEVLARARRNGRRVRAFGEMVALLWAAGNANATVRLEQLWDGFCKQESLPLFCAYPKAAFAGDAASESLAAICKVHSRLIAV